MTFPPSPRPLRQHRFRTLALLLVSIAAVPPALLAQDAPPPPPDGYGSQPDPGYQQPAYPSQQQPGYAPQGPAYPQQQPNYAPQQQGYYQQQPGYPSNSYGQQPSPYQQQPGYPDASQQQPYSEPQNYQQPQGLAPDQLAQLVAPIALYPDALLAQVLAASTYPAQLADAARWRQSLAYAPPEQVAYGANAQPWDPSVKALTAFPQVLGELAQNLTWTTQLGNAYYNQPQDVFAAVQDLRQRAQAAGTLQNTPQEAVSYNQGYIQIAPANPQVVYVPAYNPWNVYGQPLAPYPGFSLVGALGSFFGSSPVQFGLGVVMSAFTHMGWGWFGWGLDWLSHALLFDHQGYYSHSRSLVDWGLPRGGPRAYYGRREVAGMGWNRGGSYYGRGAYDSRGRAAYRGAYDRPGQMAAFNARGAYGRSVPAYRNESAARPAFNGGYRNYGGYNRAGSSYAYSPGRSQWQQQSSMRGNFGNSNRASLNSYSPWGRGNSFNDRSSREMRGYSSKSFQKSFGGGEGKRSGGGHFGGGRSGGRSSGHSGHSHHR